MRIIDTHAHIIDPVRFPLPAGKGYKPRADEAGTREAYSEVLDRHGVAHAVLVQLSGYGSESGVMVDALAASPGRFKMIVGADPDASDRALAELAGLGAAGVRFNLVSYDRAGLDGPAARRLLGRLKELGWIAQVFADDDQWPVIGPLLRTSGVSVVIDHFGVRNLAAGLAQPGFQAVLALGRTGRATVKLSAPFRVSARRNDYADLDPFARDLVAAFGLGNCIWGSDWPFPDLPDRPTYAHALAALARWLPDAADRERVLWDNPARLFGFEGSSA